MSPPTEAYLPGVLLAAALAIVLPGVPRTNMLVRRGLLAVTIALSVRYLAWRVTSTLPSADSPLDFWCALAFLALELLTMFSVFVCFLTCWRHRDNSPVADAGERRLRAAGHEVPAVDVFIPTFNESWEVLERTICGAMALDYPNLTVWVLDDTARDWLRERCRALAVRYVRRPTNEGAKAGNLNHGLAVSAAATDAPFVMVLDADFVPRRNFLYRVLGFFDDPAVGLVQTPQFFFNPNMVQHNFSISQHWVDEQRFFFDILQPAKDAWGVAICCGTSYVVRRAALSAVGGYSTECVTEDVMLSYRLMSAGYVTRYLHEKLSSGLAPETTAEYVRQRMRWALGAVQALFSQAGPFGRNNLSLLQRLMYLESANYWIALSSFWLVCLLSPILYWYFDISIFDADTGAYLAYFGPSFIATIATFTWISGGRLVPLFSDITEVISASRVAPAVWLCLLTRRSKGFHVTVKDVRFDHVVVNWPVFLEATLLAALTAYAVFQYRERGWVLGSDFGDPLLYTFWSCWNVVLLLLLAALAVERPRQRRQERFAVDEPAVIRVLDQDLTCRIEDMSLVGASLHLDCPAPFVLADRPAELRLRGVGEVPAQVVNAGPHGVRLRFDEERLPRIRVIQKLYTNPYPSVASEVRFAGTLRGILSRLLR